MNDDSRVQTQENIAEGKIGWYDYTMDAAMWWGLQSITPREAAMLLCRFNPIKASDDPTTNINDETGPEDFSRLLRILEDEASACWHQRSLKQWHNFAGDRRLKYHSWIDEYANSLQLINPSLVTNARCIELAAMNALMLRHWEEITGVGIGSDSSYIYDESGVFPVKHDQHQLKLLTREERLILLEMSDRAPLKFPCTPSELLKFIDEDLAGDFEVPDDFRVAANRPAMQEVSMVIHEVFTSDSPALTKPGEPTAPALMESTYHAHNYQADWPLCTKQEIIDGFQLTGKDWSDFLSRPNKYKEAVKQPGKKGVGGDALLSPIIFARLLVKFEDLTEGQVKTRFLKVDEWKQWEAEMIAEIGDI